MSTITQLKIAINLFKYGEMIGHDEMIEQARPKIEEYIRELESMITEPIPL